VHVDAGSLLCLNASLFDGLATAQHSKAGPRNERQIDRVPKAARAISLLKSLWAGSDRWTYIFR
jgi:hypothetical protein